jgi:hypothetical protein
MRLLTVLCLFGLFGCSSSVFRGSDDKSGASNKLAGGEDQGEVKADDQTEEGGDVEVKEKDKEKSDKLICEEMQAPKTGWGSGGASQAVATCNQKVTYVICADGNEGLSCEPYDNDLALEFVPAELKSEPTVASQLKGSNPQNHAQCLSLASKINSLGKSKSVSVDTITCFKVVLKK